jgi:hypothetical protein
MRIALRAVGLFASLLLLVGCAKMNPVAPAAPAAGVHTFVLRSLDDPRLPATALDISEPTGQEAGLFRGNGKHDEDPASFWNQITTDLARGAGLPPPRFARVYALTHVAIHDALAAGSHRYRGGFDSDAVAAGAASTVLAYLFPSQADQVAGLAAQRVKRGSAAARAFVFGQAVGSLVVEYGMLDRSDTPFTGAMPSGDGLWTGTNPVLPMCGTWKCWIIESGDAIQPEPPYLYGSPEDLAEVEVVREAALNRTPEQIAAVHKWADRAPPMIWNVMLLERLAAERWDAIESARAFAYLNVAIFDGFVSCWGSKYTYWTARPFQRIAGLVTVITTPNFPSYTSGHSTISGAAAEVMSELFPGDAAFYRAEASEAADSRLWGGIHYPRDNVQGQIVGKAIGERVVEVMRSDGARRGAGDLVASRQN